MRAKNSTTAPIKAAATVLLSSALKEQRNSLICKDFSMPKDCAI